MFFGGGVGEGGGKGITRWSRQRRILKGQAARMPQTVTVQAYHVFRWGISETAALIHNCLACALPMSVRLSCLSMGVFVCVCVCVYLLNCT